MIGSITRISVVTVALMVLSFTSAVAGVDNVYKKPDTEKSWGELLADLVGYGGYKRSYALVVGISQYSDGYSPLPTKNDALHMRDYLINEAGFDYVHVVTEEKVTPARIRTLMLNEFRNNIDRNDRFVFYWSGHGIDVDNAIGGKEGFLPVANSPKGAIDTMVSMTNIRRYDSLIRANQALYLLDACFSGLAVSSKSDPPRLSSTATREYNISQLARPSHHLISAGTAEEETIASAHWGGSLFTWALLHGLRGAADAQNAYPRDGVVSLSELIAYLKPTIESERLGQAWTKKITPQLQHLRSNQGEFFFVTNREKIAYLNERGGQPTGKFAFGKAVAKHAAAPSSPGDQITVPDTQSTDMISSDFEIANQIGSIQALGAFVKKYDNRPNSFLVGLARATLNTLEAKEQQSAALNLDSEPAPSTTLAAPPEPQSSETESAKPALSEIEITLRILRIQWELQRLGCNPGTPDGVWGPKSKRALERFAKYAKVTVAEREPTQEVLSLLKPRSGRDCPKECDPGFHRLNGICMIITCPPGQIKRTSKGVCFKPRTTTASKP